MVQRAAMASLHKSLPSPKLALFPRDHSFVAFAAHASKSSDARPAALPATTTAPLWHFIASAAEAVEPSPIYREKALFDCFGASNLSISVALGALSAVGAEAGRTNLLARLTVPEDEEEAPQPEFEPFDWLLVLQGSLINLARDAFSKIVQQIVEICAKARVPKWVHDELIKQVPYFSSMMRGPPPATWHDVLSSRVTSSRAVVMSKIPYVSRGFAFFVGDALVDVARLSFPDSWRSRLVLHSDNASVACLTTNLKLKIRKHALAGGLSYSLHIVSAFVLPGGGAFFVAGFLLSDVAASFIADAIVAQYGEIK